MHNSVLQAHLQALAEVSLNFFSLKLQVVQSRQPKLILYGVVYSADANNHHIRSIAMSSTASPASRVSGTVPPPHVVEDCLGLVQLLSDGTVLPDGVPLPSADAPGAVRWKDVVYDETHCR